MGKDASSGPTPVRQRKQKGRIDSTLVTVSSSAAGGLNGQLTCTLLSMPMEVFLEVASHLKPLDLLHLARVSSTFRNTLLSRNSRRTWAAARKNVVPEIPDGPQDLSEPLYARLLFERDCMKCGAVGADKVDYANFHRYCITCWRVQPGGQLVYNSGLYYDPNFKNLIYDLLPPALARKCTGQDKHQNPNGWEEPSALTGRKKNTEHTMYHENDLAALAEEYRRVCAGETDMSLEEFVTKHSTRARKRLLFQTEILMVEYDRRQAQILFAERMTDRKLAIEEKLRELDYEPEDYPANDPNFNAMFEQRAALTPRIWNTIRPKLLSALQVERRRRADEAFRIKWFMRTTELRPLYEHFVKTQATKESQSEDVWARTMPDFRTAVGLPSMRALLTSARPSEHVSEKDFAAIRSALVRDVQEAMTRARHYCVNMLRDAAGNGAQTSTGKASTSTQKGRSVSKDKGKSKGKGKAHDCTQESLETQIGIDDLFADDPAEADRAILERFTSLFECDHPVCLQRQQNGNPMRKNYVMTFLGLLQHDALAHPSPSWDSVSARPAAETMRALMPRLFDALGMPRSTTLSALHERLSYETPGRCSCGMVFNMPHMIASVSDSDSECLDLTILLQHINGSTSHVAPMYIPNGVHNHNIMHSITLSPRPALDTVQLFNRDMPKLVWTQGDQCRPLATLEMYHFMTKILPTANGFHGTSARDPEGPVGPEHPHVQERMRYMGELFNDPEVLLERLRGKRRR